MTLSSGWWVVAGQGPPVAPRLLPLPRPWLALHPQAWSARLEGQTQLPSAWGLGGGRRKPQACPATHAPPEGWVPCRPALPSKGKASANIWPSTGAWGWGSRGLTRPGALACRGPPESPGPGIPQWTENHILSGCRVPPGPSTSQDVLLPSSSFPGLPDLTPIPQAVGAQGIFNKN